mgnify:CR=1 FL=1
MLSKGFKIISPKTFEIDVDTVKSKIGNAIVKVVIIVVKWFRYIYAKEKRKCRIMYIQFLYLKQDRT